MLNDARRNQGRFFPIRSRRLLCSVSASESLKLTQEKHHHDYYQIYYTQKGSMTHYVNENFTRVMRGDVFIVPPFTPHQIKAYSEPLSFVSFSFFEEFLPDNIRQQESIQRLFSVLDSNDLRGRIALTPPEMLRIEELMRFAQDEFNRASVGYECVLQNILAAILILLSRAYAHEKWEVKHNAALSAGLEYINLHFAQHLTGKEVAKQMYLSESTFYRTFKRLTGHTFKEYLTMVRIRHACTLLRDEAIPVSMVAEQCGYGDYSAFYRAFLQQMHVSPNVYRRSYE